MSDQKTARLYRMVMEKHVCPYGLKSKDLLEREGFAIDDHHLTTRKQTDRFKDKHDVETTPQTFINGKRIGGYDDLRIYFGKDRPKEKQSEWKLIETTPQKEGEDAFHFYEWTPLPKPPVDNNK